MLSVGCSLWSAGQPCTDHDMLTDSQLQGFASSRFIVPTINAVYAFAYGLTKLFKDRCGGMIIPPCQVSGCQPICL